MPSLKKIAPGQEHGYIGQTKSKTKPRIITESEFLTKYIYERDQLWLEDLFTAQELKDEILKKRQG